ncbi:nuclear transport factor 2 family protein [Pseudomonas putida]|uniref:nuclear transport factor 2 family protein n=1 Tax=Pseudomonas TaxID=286 RepID=UPI00105A494C|nr:MULTISPECIES: nuclear transport factor 2 family protein [Pseudomonas]MBF8747025.1 nuclear transport factor 2 family protein [Pseudomonas monteilii]MCT8166817.1 nuclear transport factor 2 family protein [Pseudomonas sp. HD6422]MCT8185713.1 nuclear transport factor 2 family protein [Pseudomonas sp. HD6421]TDJ75808.1 nuclear transport factor 2 family protein [Pseudomonas putida]
MSDYLQRFAQRFASLDASTLDDLGNLYDENVTFRDPLHELKGLQALRGYFDQLYANTHDIRYAILGADELSPGQGYLRWSLQFRHPRLASGQPIQVQGCSYLQWRDRVHFHQDYFDAGALLYEHVPVMGSAIRWLKGRLK